MKALFAGLLLTSFGTIAAAQSQICEALYQKKFSVIDDHNASLQEVDKKYSNGSYRGTMYDGRICGKGGYYFDSGQIQYGHWLDGKLLFGTKIFTSGSVRIGGYKSDGTFVDTEEGFTEIYDSGALYLGNYKDNKRDGFGTYLGNNGSIYQGGFSEGKYHGFASFCSGSRSYNYKGHFKDGKRHGKGEIYYKDGIKFQGVWDQGEVVFGLGKRDGKDSVFYTKNGEINSRRPKGWCADNGYGEGVSDQCTAAISRRAQLDNEEGKYSYPNGFVFCEDVGPKVSKHLDEAKKWVEKVKFLRPN